MAPKSYSEPFSEATKNKLYGKSKNMHKIFLTEQEASVISGSEEIIKELGGFPSMENGNLCSICVKRSDPDFKYDISMIFDIEKWKNDSSAYKEFSSSAIRFIDLKFKGARSIQLNNPIMTYCNEIKFSNTLDKDNWNRDNSPFHTKIIKRPFCVFYIGTGRELAIEFDESECLISASAREAL